MNLLEFNFTASNCNGWPKLKFYIDDDLYQDYEFLDSSATVQLPLEVLDGKHCVSIELYGKTINNTLVQDNVIVMDQLVTLENIKVDNVQLPTYFLYQGRVDNQPDSPQLTWGINGSWRWYFYAPIIDWIIFVKNNNAQTADLNLTVTSSFSNEKNSKLLELLDQIENELGNEQNP